MSQPLPPHRDNPETTHEEPIYLFTDKAVVPPRPRAAQNPADAEEPDPPEQEPGR